MPNDATFDVTITGESPDDDCGWQVAPAGDVNGDGIADIIVGAPSNGAVAGFAGRALRTNLAAAELAVLRIG